MTQGRFTSEDILKGYLAQPNTLNSYTYCLNQPEDFVDLDGREAVNNGGYTLLYLNNNSRIDLLTEEEVVKNLLK